MWMRMVDSLITLNPTEDIEKGIEATGLVWSDTITVTP